MKRSPSVPFAAAALILLACSTASDPPEPPADASPPDLQAVPAEQPVTAFCGRDAVPPATSLETHADVVALHDAILAVANLFKDEVLVILDLTLPNRVEGDND